MKKHEKGCTGWGNGVWVKGANPDLVDLVDLEDLVDLVDLVSSPDLKFESSPAEHWDVCELC